jgi:response regulator NasT
MPDASAAVPAEAASDARSLRVVVADSDPDAHPFYRQFLARLGHQVCVAVAARQLAEQCRLLRPDLVITSTRLPDLDGFAAAEEVCRDRPVPIILVGEDGAEADPRVLANECVLAWLFRPVREPDLGAAVALAVRRFERLQSLRAEVAELRQALEDRKLIERAKGLVMRYAGGEEEEAYRRLRKMASDQNQKLVEVARAVLAAGEVFQQMECLGSGPTGNDGRRRTPHRPHAGDSP